MNLSFSGCGFLGIYHVGVASCFKEHAPYLVTGKICGTSAGAIAACCFLCDVCLGQCTSWVLRLAAKARARSLGPLHPSFHMVQMLKDGISDILPENCHEICSGRLFVSLTRVSDRKNIIVSQYDSKHDLIQALICSAFIPFYCGLVPPTYKGVRYVDGGLSDNLPVLDEDTVTISPFAGETDISPTDESHNFTHITLANMSFQFTACNLYRLSRALFPPHPEILSQICKRGFDDALKYLQQNNLISCMRHLSIKSTLTPIYCDSDDDDEYEDEVDHAHVGSDVACKYCDNRKQMALVENLPPSVVSALQAACDSVNHGILAYIYKNRTFQVLSFAMSPWLLPLDILYNIVVKFLRWIPYLPEDARNFTSEVVELVRLLLKRIETHSHMYSARFTCQVAITEVNYKPARRSTYADITSEYHNEPVIRNLNIGFAVDFEAGLGDEEVPSTAETLKQLEARLETLDIESLDIETHGPDGQNMKLHAEGKNISANTLIPCDEIMDTFEQCISASNRRNSVLAYYYNDEKPASANHLRRRSSINVTELYTLKQSDISRHRISFGSMDEESEYSNETDMSGSLTTIVDNDQEKDVSFDLSWDEYTEEKIDTVNSTDCHKFDFASDYNESHDAEARNDELLRIDSFNGSETNMSPIDLSWDDINVEQAQQRRPSTADVSGDGSFVNIDEDFNAYLNSDESEPYVCDFRLYSNDEFTHPINSGKLSDADSGPDSFRVGVESTSSFSSLSTDTKPDYLDKLCMADQQIASLVFVNDDDNLSERSFPDENYEDSSVFNYTGNAKNMHNLTYTANGDDSVKTNDKFSRNASLGIALDELTEIPDVLYDENDSKTEIVTRNSPTLCSQ